MTPWRVFLTTIARNPISLFAVFCVACTAGFLAYMSKQQLNVLASSEWCGKALQAERISAQNFGGLTACVDLLKIQLQAVAMGFHIGLGAYAFSLIVLVVVVISGARASAKLPGGGEFDVGRDPVPAAAQAVADSAQSTADTIKENV